MSESSAAPVEPTASTSHVFVTRGDLLHVACDAWLLPTDSRMHVERPWLDVPEVERRLRDAAATEALDDLFAVALAPTGSSDVPRPIATTVPLHGVSSEGGLEQLIEAVRRFVAVGAQLPRVTKRPRRLLAMPAFGTGKGGGGADRGRVLKAVLDAVTVAAAAHEVDVVIVLRDAATFAHLQAIRRARRSTWSLSADHWRNVERLADLARRRRLVPFMGAGVSVTAGAPTWNKLIERLADDAGLRPDERQQLLESRMSALDQAAVLEQSFVTKGEFRAAIKRIVDLDRYGLAPALLASLGAPQAITLNYDGLYELASEDVHGERLTLISHETSAHSAERWLLKLHGTASAPETIVLTRDDYLGYATTRNALSAIVKANLLTNHLLFVGFGFADDHFHQIVHDVRLAVAPNDATHTATTLQLRADPLRERLHPEVAPVVLGTGDDAAEAGRAVEIFLDALVAHATDDAAYLLNDDFEGVLDDPDVAFKQWLLAAVGQATPEVRSSAGWSAVESLLSELGGGRRA